MFSRNVLTSGEQHMVGSTRGRLARIRELHSEPDFHPRFVCLSRLLKYLGGHLKSLKLYKTRHNVALKRLASAVQLRPWPPSFQSVSSAPNLTSVPFCSKIKIQACRSLPRIVGNFFRLVPNL